MQRMVQVKSVKTARSKFNREVSSTVVQVETYSALSRELDGGLWEWCGVPWLCERFRDQSTLAASIAPRPGKNIVALADEISFDGICRKITFRQGKDVVRCVIEFEKETNEIDVTLGMLAATEPVPMSVFDEGGDDGSAE